MRHHVHHAWGEIKGSIKTQLHTVLFIVYEGFGKPKCLLQFAFTVRALESQCDLGPVFDTFVLCPDVLCLSVHLPFYSGNALWDFLPVVQSPSLTDMLGAVCLR